MGDFPNQVNVAQAPAVAGDFASKNPRYSYDAGPFGLVAGPAGVTVGRFAWATAPLDGDGAPASVSNSGAGTPSGFVHREQQSIIVNYLAASGNVIQPGFGLTLMIGGDYWVKNEGATEALYGQKAYASFADGHVSFAATGAPSTAAATGSIAAGAGASATGTISGNIFTAASALSGTFHVGGILSGTNVVAGSQIVSQLPLQSGEATGGLGRYLLNIGEQTVASTTVSETWGVFTAASALSGLFGPGMSLSGPGGSSDPVAAGTYIVSQLTGPTGGIGTYLVNLTQTSSSATITAGTNIETKYFARSTGLPGELVKISPTLNA